MDGSKMREPGVKRAEPLWADRVITPRRAAIAGMIAPALWASLLVLLDIVQYDFLVSIGSDPLTKGPASENALGPIGWLYMVNDGVFGVLVITFALGLRQAVDGSQWIWLGIASLLAFGAGFIVGVSPCDCIPGQPTTLHGTIHNIASYVLLVATIPMTLFTGLGFRKDPRWRRYALYSIATGVLAFPLFVVANALPPVVSWFYIWLLAIPLAWLEITALRLWTLSERAARAGEPTTHS